MSIEAKKMDDEELADVLSRSANRFTQLLSTTDKLLAHIAYLTAELRKFADAIEDSNEDDATLNRIIKDAREWAKVRNTPRAANRKDVDDGK